MWCGRQPYVLPLPIDLGIPLQLKMPYINHPKALSPAKIIISLLRPLIIYTVGLEVCREVFRNMLGGGQRDNWREISGVESSDYYHGQRIVLK